MPRSLIGRLGRWCFRHWGWVFAVWAVAAAAGVAATGPLFDRLADSGVPRSVESVAAYDVLNAGNGSAGTVIGVVDGVDPSSPDVERGGHGGGGAGRGHRRRDAGRPPVRRRTEPGRRPVR